MSSSLAKRIFLWAAVVFALWLGVRYLLPLLLPFLLGGLVALSAEPAVGFLRQKFRLGPRLAAAIGVTATLLFFIGLLYLLGAILVRELYRLADSMPNLGASAKQGMQVLENWATDLTHKAPKGVQPLLENTVSRTFSGGNLIMDQLSSKVPAFAANFLSGVPNSALLLGTGLLSSYMICWRLPKIRSRLRSVLPKSWQEQYLPAIKRAKKAMGGWLRAQGILLLMIYTIVTAGFLLLKIPYGPFWALLIALMDAVPMLGTGLVLLPWGVISFLMGNSLRGFGLLAIFAAAIAARTVTEPKLLGRHLDLDPLVTLIALYAGYRIWGFWGLLAAPIFTAAVKSAYNGRE